jgi:hypothetical protein
MGSIFPKEALDMNRYNIAQIKEYAHKLRANAPFIALLLTISLLAAASAVYIIKYASDFSYRKKWEDYDDCGLA